jgi:putative transposon-encoded protein
MGSQKNIENKVEHLRKKIEALRHELEEILPYAIIKDTAPFGNSAHVVLSKELIDKKVGVIVFGKQEVNANG